MNSTTENTAIGRTTEMPLSYCPSCGYKMNAATSLENDAVPKSGDFSVCLRCGEILRFDENLLLRVVPLKEWDTLPKYEKEVLLKYSVAARRVHMKEE